LWDSLTTSIAFVQSHTQSFVVAILFSAAEYAPLAAGLVLFGPFRTATMALGNTLRPDFSRSLAAGNHASVKSSLRFGIMGMTAMSIGFLIFIWLFWAYVYQFLFASKFSGVSIGLIVFLNGVAALIYTNANVLQFYLQARLFNQTITYSRILGAIVAVLSVMPLLHHLPVAYSVISLILAEGASLIYLAVVVYRDVKNLVPHMPNNIAKTK
jgi:O-antigen/teichoic acid export membrane protein